MRRLLLPALAALMLSAACGSGPVAPRSAPSSATGGPAATPPTAGPPASGTPAVSPPAGADPENPRDPIGAPIVVTGTVRRERGCVVLESGGRRWALTGPAAERLAEGPKVTVRGRPVAVPAGCDADFGVALRSTAGK